jgi:hypothetical protein
MAELSALERAVKNKKHRNYMFLALMGVVMLTIILPIIYIIISVFRDSGEELYKHIALLILLVWFAGLGAYYAWAIYFYNINLGLTNESWAELKEKNKLSPDATSTTPIRNPHADETLGLPKGTIRGTLALTLLIGGLAMTIAALGMKNSISEDTFLVDNFDFFKTAFLMMIAFYFGNKSLEMIGYKSKKTYSKADGNSEAANSPVSNQPIPVAPADVGKEVSKLLNGGDTVSDAENITSTDEEDFNYPGAAQ